MIFGWHPCAVSTLQIRGDSSRRPPESAKTTAGGLPDRKTDKTKKPNRLDFPAKISQVQVASQTNVLLHRFPIGFHICSLVTY